MKETKIFIIRNGTKKQIKSKTTKIDESYNKFFNCNCTVYRTMFDEPINMTNDDKIEIEEMP